MTFMSPHLILFLVFEAFWFFGSFGFLGIIGNDSICKAASGAACNAAESTLITLNSLNGIYYLIPFPVLAWHCKDDQSKTKGLLVLAFGISLLELGGHFFTISTAFSGGFVDAGLHFTLTVLRLIVIGVLFHGFSSSNTPGPIASSVCSGLSGCTPKAYLLFVTVFAILPIVTNMEMGDYDEQLNMTKDMITPFLACQWNWANIVTMNSFLFYMYMIVYGKSSEQAMLTVFAVIWLIIVNLILFFSTSVALITTTEMWIWQWGFTVLTTSIGVWAYFHRGPTSEDTNTTSYTNISTIAETV